MGAMTTESEPKPSVQRPRAITWKSLGIGLIGVILLAAFEGYNYEVLKQTPLAGHYFPLMAFGSLFLLAAVWNPICHRCCRFLVLRSSELVVVLSLLLVASWIPGGGLYRTLYTQIMMPWNYEAGKPQWQEYALLDYLPREGFPLEASEDLVVVPGVGLVPKDDVQTQGLVYQVRGQDVILAQKPVPVVDDQGQTVFTVPGIGEVPIDAVQRVGVQVSVADQGEFVVDQIHDYEKVYTNFYSGMGPDDVIPWDAWIPVVLYWLPLLAVFAITLIAMAMVVHRQWSRNEQLSYPLAQVGWSMLQRSDSKSLPDVFRSRLFLVGVAVVMFLELAHFAHLYFPLRLPDIQMSTELGFMWHMVPHASNAGLQGLNSFRFYPLLFGLAYFVSAEVALTLGLSQILLLVVGVEFYISSGTQMNGSLDVPVMRAGSYVMYLLVILYVGRHYYGRVLGKAFGFYRSDDSISVDGTWAARVFLSGFVALWALLCWQFDIDYLVALLYVMLTMGMLLVFSRVICETGMPYMQAAWNPGIILGKIFGFSAMGAAPVVILYYLSSLIVQDTRESLTPFVANSLHVSERAGVLPRKIGVVAVVAIAVCLVVGFGARMHQYYGNGALGEQADPYASVGTPKDVFDQTTLAFDHLVQTGHFEGEIAEGRMVLDRDAQGQLVERNPSSGLGKLLHIEPDRRALGFFLAGMLGVAVFFVCRLRFSAFPLHPVLFLVWGTWPMQAGSLSFLIGWGAKELVVRFGGGRVYQDLKPLFIGIIVGELLASMTGVGMGSLYHLMTGEIPEYYNTFIA